ncbi:MAG: prenyltransferase [Prevotella sp.]|nr:prenyltransferase [Prevotella sp.]
MSTNNNTRKKTFKDWVIATKPWSFNVSATSVIVTGAYLYYNNLQNGGGFDWLNLILATIMMVCFQASGNLLSDFRDFIYGIDKPGNDNEVKWISSGLFKPTVIRNYGYVMLGIASLIGLILLYRTSWEIIWIGILGFIFTGAYSWFKFHALGDFDILCCFALLPSIGTSFVVTGQYHFEVLLISLTFGLFTCGLLHYNNTRDIESDSEAGITTLPILIGRKASKVLYFCFELLPFLITVVLIVVGILPLITLIVFVALPSAIKLVRTMVRSRCAQDLGGLDEANAKQQLMFSVMLLVGIIVTCTII